MEDQIKLELTPEQQAIENKRLAEEVLKNPVFKKVFESYTSEFDHQINNLDPMDDKVFTVLQAARKYINLFKKSLEAYTADPAKHGGLI